MAKMDNPTLCLDTSVLIAFLKGREPAAAAVVQAVQTRVCYVTAITVYELLFGLVRAQKSIGEEDLLDALMVVPLDEAAARRAAILHDQLLRRNEEIGIKDILIAATCLTHSLPILTLNVRHFTRVPELDVLSPEEFLAQA